MLDFIIINLFQPYLIIIIIALILSFISISFIEQLSKKERLYLLSAYNFSILGMVIGSKVLFLTENMICNNQMDIIVLSGFYYMGGVVGYIIFNKVYNKIYKNVPTIINSLLLLAIPLIYSISKIACFFTGCCSGTQNIPIQLAECIIYLVIFIICMYLYRKKEKKELMANLSIILLCLCRFIVDFYRIKRGIVLMNLTLTQIICISLIFVKLIKITRNMNK